MTHKIWKPSFRYSALVATLLATGAYAQQRTFNLPEQDATQSIPEFARQAGIQISAPAEALKGMRTPSIKGELDVREALERLLQGTGLAVASDENGMIVLRKSAVLGEVSDATASSNPSDKKDEPQTEKLEEIVVTATKRSESLMKVPESITAITAASIANRGLVSADEYLRSVPGIAYTDLGPGQNAVNIRGVVSVPFNAGATVGQYFGEVPLTGLALGSSVDVKLIDMERVEVLRGPQGTLYGSNSLNGTIRAIPKPVDLTGFESNVGVEYSSTGGFGGNNGAIDGVLNLPIAQDRFAIRAVLYRYENSGFIKNAGGNDAALAAAAAFYGASSQIGSQDDLGKGTVTGGRISARWQPIENFDATFTYLRQDDAANDWAFSTSNVGRYRRSDYRLSDVAGTDPLETSLDLQNLTMEYRTPWGAVISSTSFLNQDTRRAWQLGTFGFLQVGGQRAPVWQNSLTKAEALSQELRFASEFDGPFQVVAGMFYEDTEQPTEQVAYYTGSNLAVHPFTNGTTPTVGVPRSAQAIYGADIDRATKQVAGFGEVSYQVTPELKLTAGMRYFDYDFTFKSGVNGFWRNPIATLPLFVRTAGETGNNFKGSVEYEPLDNALLYAKFSQGFRLGRPKNVSQLSANCDLNNDGLIDGSQLSAVDPLIASDSLDSYEVGGKTMLFGSRLALAGSVYRIEWSDIPVTVPVAGCAVTSTFNAGKVTVDGFELEGTGRIAALTVDFGIGNNLSRLANTTTLGVEGARMNNTPRWNGHVGAEYGVPVFSRVAFLRADFTYYGDYWTGLNKAGVMFDAYRLIDVSARMSVSDNLNLRLFANNVTDEDAYTVPFSTTGMSNAFIPLRPRTIGVRLDVSF